MKKLLNKWDIAVIVLTVVFSVGLYFAINLFDINQGPVAQIYHQNKLVATMDLDFDDIIVLEQEKYPDLYGDFEIEVKDGKVHILKETCPLGICVDLGWTDSSVKPLVCLPNQILVVIENDEQPESDVVNQ